MIAKRWPAFPLALILAAAGCGQAPETPAEQRQPEYAEQVRAKLEQLQTAPGKAEPTRGSAPGKK